MSQGIDPVRKEVRVPLSVEKAFALFTDRMTEWWPLASHSVGGERAKEVVFEGKTGGRIYETLDDGSESDWGRVVGWNEPTSVTFTWHPGRDRETEGDVEVRFVADGDSTVVTLVHSGWEKLGAEAQRTRAGYDTGWDFVLGECYVGAAGAAHAAARATKPTR